MVIGIEVFKPHLQRIKSLELYDGLVLHDFRRALPFKDNTFDILIACQVLEHNEKEKMINALSECERVVKEGGLILIGVPHGFVQRPYRHGNPFSQHRSAWYPADFKRFGFKVVLIPSARYPRTLMPFARVRQVLFRLPKYSAIFAEKTLRCR